MNISFNHFSSIASETFFLFKERLLPSLTDQQKKIVLIVSVVFSLLAAICYVISRIRFKAKPLLERDAGKEIQVPVGKPFSIQLCHSSSTGHDSWKISEIPSFINELDQSVNYQNHASDIDGGGDNYVFVFEPKESGKGDIIMQQPCSFDSSRTVEKKFTIIAK